MQGVPHKKLAGGTGGKGRWMRSRMQRRIPRNLNRMPALPDTKTRRAKIFCVKKETIRPAKFLTGGVALPGDKSISHRYAMLAALAEGASELRHFSAAADCHSTLRCLSALGAEIKIEKDTVRITGKGPRGLKESRRALDAGNSGTTMRLLAGI